MRGTENAMQPRLCRGFDLSLYFLLNLPVAAGEPVALARAAMDGGVTTIQLRGKGASAGEMYEVAESLLPLTSSRGVALIINDRLDVAMGVGADGVHLGRDDLPVAVARRLAPHLIIGASCYGSHERGATMVEEGADYIAFGSVFSSPTKPNAPVIGLDVFAPAQALDVPIVAIGGITPDHITSLHRAGVDGAAVISAIQMASEPSVAAANFARAWEASRSA